MTIKRLADHLSVIKVIKPQFDCRAEGGRRVNEDERRVSLGEWEGTKYNSVKTLLRAT